MIIKPLKLKNNSRLHTSVKSRKSLIPLKLGKLISDKKQFFVLLLFFVFFVTIIFTNIISPNFIPFLPDLSVSDEGQIQENQSPENVNLINEINNIFILPENEVPTIATVENKDSLKDSFKNEEFFLKSENGDKLLIYVESKLAILYRPSIKKIVSVSNVQIGE